MEFSFDYTRFILAVSLSVFLGMGAFIGAYALGECVAKRIKERKKNKALKRRFD